MSRLIAISNRCGPIRGAAQAGGLAVGLLDALKSHHGIWFGWSGETSEKETDLKVEEEGQLKQVTADFPKKEFDSYYNFANRCLWPLLHFRIDLTDFQPEEFQAYLRINSRFADRLLPLLEPDDLIWVHDYHLFPLASELRARGVRNRIGFFLHTPFPPGDVLATLPGYPRLLRALFDYDVLGFQTEDDNRRFRDFVFQETGASAMDVALEAYGHSVVAAAFPIGMDADRFHKMAFSAHGEREFRRMRDSLRDHAQIIGVDRLDYSKGLLRRMLAVEQLLERFPEARRRTQYLQIAPISRGELKAYRDFRRELDQAAARINSRFGEVHWTPVHYLNRSVPRRTLAGLYRAARIALVTPMRDGMNLVAKEYVAAQDADDPGVLVLSKFAGAAQQMQAALLVNPYDTAEVADAMQQALCMPIEERRRRHEELDRGLREQDSTWWAESFIQALARPYHDGEYAADTAC